ncbi:MAG: hypothetical protein ACOC44_11685 [Promethearchaeia archaeon]
MNNSNEVFLTSFLLISLISIGLFAYPSAGIINTADENIEWNITSGENFKWRVTQSNGSSYYFPSKSEFQMTIDTINSLETSASQINVTFSVYNSSSLTTETLLEESQYLFFNSSSGELKIARSRFTDTGFFVPSNYVGTYADALNESYAEHTNFNNSHYIIDEGILKEFHSYSENREHYLSWYFNEKGLTTKFTVVHDAEIIYQVELYTRSGTSDNNNSDDDSSADSLIWIIILVAVSGGAVLTGGVYYILRKTGK